MGLCIFFASPSRIQNLNHNTKLYDFAGHHDNNDQDLTKNDIEEDPKIVKWLKNFNESQEIEAFNSQVFECIICFSEKLGNNCLKFAECQHVFCNECMKSHFEVRISQGEYV